MIIECAARDCRWNTKGVCLYYGPTLKLFLSNNIVNNISCSEYDNSYPEDDDYNEQREKSLEKSRMARFARRENR